MMKRIRAVNPATGRTIRQVPADGPASIRAKYEAARAAQPAWAAAPMKKRLAAITNFRTRVAAESERLAQVLMREVGKPISQARGELRGLLGRIDFFLGAAPDALKPAAVWRDRAAGLSERITREPLGVIANISAWNYPYYVGGNVFLPALLAGNSVLYKPSEFATLTGLEIGRLLRASGVPREVFVPLIGGGDVGAALLDLPIDGVFFTGSHATGRSIAESVAGKMVKLQLELGGKDPVYVCEDVDLGKAAASVADGAFYNNGQSCCSVERVYVHRAVHERFVAAFVAEVEGYRIGNPASDETYIGPLTRPSQIAVLEAQIADARKKGAAVLTGGGRVRGPGNFFQPTVLARVDHSMAVMREETFGPVVGIMEAANDGEAVGLMNDTEYGLTAGVYTRDRRRAERILALVKSGSAYWNCCDRVSPRLPWSGIGKSGIGVTLSTEGIQAMTRPKAWHLRKG